VGSAGGRSGERGPTTSAHGRSAGVTRTHRGRQAGPGSSTRRARREKQAATPDGHHGGGRPVAGIGRYDRWARSLVTGCPPPGAPRPHHTVKHRRNDYAYSHTVGNAGRCVGRSSLAIGHTGLPRSLGSLARGPRPCADRRERVHSIECAWGRRPRHEESGVLVQTRRG
jgi:hypothetical protein